MNSFLIWIPCCIVWAFIFLYALGFLTVSVYSRMMKKKDGRPGDGCLTGPASAGTAQTTGRKSIRQLVKDYLFGLARYYSILIGRVPSHHLRKALLRSCFGMSIHKHAVIYGGFELRSPWKIRIGNAVVGTNALLDGRSGIIIHDHVTLAQNVCIFTLQHDVRDPHFATTGKSGMVEIESFAWISSNCTVLPRVHVEQGAVLASCAVATKDIEPYAVCAGIPTQSYWHFY